MLLESGAEGEVRATSDDTKLAHFGPADPEPPSTGPLGPPRAEGHRVHVIGPRGRFESPAGRPYFRFYADSTEPTSRAFLLYSAREPGWSVDFHEHSTDELVFLLTGSVRFGKRQRYAAGSCLALAAGQRYALAAGPEGFTSINYRRDASTLRYPGRERSWLETGATAGGIPIIEQG